MSWSGFKKNLNRAQTTLMQRAGAIDKTVDNEFEVESQRYRAFEEKSNKLSKEAKGYLDSLRVMTQTQTRLATTIHNFYDDSAPLGACGTKYKHVIDNLDVDCREQMDNAYRQTVLEPFNRLCAYFPEVNDVIKRRNKKLLDYDAMRSKVRKLVDKPSDDLQRLPRAEEEANLAHQLYEELNTLLITELPQLVDLRVPYIEPSFEALVKNQLKFCEDSYNSLEAIRSYFPSENEKLETKVEEVLQTMRDLSICGM